MNISLPAFSPLVTPLADQLKLLQLIAANIGGDPEQPGSQASRPEQSSSTPLFQAQGAQSPTADRRLDDHALQEEAAFRRFEPRNTAQTLAGLRPPNVAFAMRQLLAEQLRDLSSPVAGPSSDENTDRRPEVRQVQEPRSPASAHLIRTAAPTTDHNRPEHPSPLQQPMAQPGNSLEPSGTPFPSSPSMAAESAKANPIGTPAAQDAPSADHRSVSEGALPRDGMTAPSSSLPVAPIHDEQTVQASRNATVQSASAEISSKTEPTFTADGNPGFQDKQSQISAPETQAPRERHVLSLGRDTESFRPEASAQAGRNAGLDGNGVKILAPVDGASGSTETQEAAALANGNPALLDPQPKSSITPSSAPDARLAGLGFNALDVSPLPERAGVIASFVLNAHFLPGWPPPRPFEMPAALAAHATLAERLAELTEQEAEKLLYLSKLGLTPGQLERILRLMARARKRSAFFDTLVAALTNIGAVLDALRDEAAAIAEELLVQRQVALPLHAGRGRERLAL